MMKKSALSYDTYQITAGPHKGRIGYYDDDDETGKYAIVYFGIMELGAQPQFVAHRYLADLTTSALMARHEAIFHRIGIGAVGIADAERVDLLSEMLLISEQLSERMFHARLVTGNNKRVFISHSSKDKQFARFLSVDLANAGHHPWLDEWDIRVGESIPTKIADGLENCDALIIILSEHSVSSKWVESEWQAKYWDEITQGRIQVLPVLLKPCNVPTLLKTKKYANFTDDYDRGLEELLLGLGRGK
jgi:hypothetical protein